MFGSVYLVIFIIRLPIISHFCCIIKKTSCTTIAVLGWKVVVFQYAKLVCLVSELWAYHACFLKELATVSVIDRKHLKVYTNNRALYIGLICSS